MELVGRGDDAEEGDGVDTEEELGISEDGDGEIIEEEVEIGINEEAEDDEAEDELPAADAPILVTSNRAVEASGQYST